ncbi:bifunctional riboflavin kinase/FAD synthetase [Fusibacter bizertensis]|jgi:riboflavin kinase/FMN adenylyltransferase|uniref:Riboflavin biosynthesis protein n=1 Tax=Fusibacter bizertensis TaxID=1488331 RepID=A0ABT6N840_9FIRM|nr:bifunctional riboflavin kinase/FAD synthetase [Fusibacter bizertensis]MDH8676581.1 bifunctional riboflavin kinase/FAD synthetase [Fusibacter bizertensis]
MKIFFEIEEIDIENEATSVALGTFDGLHIGHAEVLNIMKEAARLKGLKSFVYTFSNHPKEFLTPDQVPPKIMDIDEKVQIFTRVDVDYLALIRFDEAQILFEPEDFVKTILIDKLNMKHLTVGYDYRFGKKANGNVALLIELSEKYGYTYEIVQPIMRNDVRVSSSLIRELLSDGRIEEANFYLGRKHFIKGLVVRGKGMGHKLGFPTANLRIKDNISTIKPGVYITETLWKGDIYPSVTNVGFNPTFEQTGIHLETYILGVDQEMYDEIIEVHFVKRLRAEIKFNHVDELIVAMQGDLSKTKAYFNI